MNDQVVKPEKITKPIQLLAAWLLGLFSIDASFLFTATTLPADSFASHALIAASIFNVPIFLVAVFLLQTKFRPELQEDSYYSTYLSQKTNEPISVSKESTQISRLTQKITELEAGISTSHKAEMPVLSSLSNLAIGINTHLADKESISNRLSDAGVLSYTLFGSTKPPNGRNVAIARYLPSNIVREVVAIARELGFKTYTMFDNQAEGTEEEILFGAYGDPEFEIAGSNA